MLQAGLLYLALTEPDRRRSLCTDIVLTSRDNLNYVLSELTRLVAETWPKMSQNIRSNLVSLLADLIATKGASVEVLMLHIYRRMSKWLESTDRQSFLLPLTVYTLLRLIPDHNVSVPAPNGSTSSQVTASTASLHSSLIALRQRESNLAIDFIRRYFDRCSQLGRELIRLLHALCRIEPFAQLWQDLFKDISTLSNHFKSVSELLDIMTPQCFTQTLIPHEMEQWIRWMMRNVHCVPGFPVRRYQEFFQVLN
ncbi:unnamed protein product [Protopolystoma xenopodis]|uniref:Integrator complex subunit 3 N-terminal domain-containing protein n=1 Tax=Protopolystoma xenopodis TaxID=117903 RepID=A0A448X0N5_9PLAT|nr:unnamed protein product [Protopolystoma xenopodis]